LVLVVLVVLVQHLVRLPQKVTILNFLLCRQLSVVDKVLVLATQAIQLAVQVVLAAAAVLALPHKFLVVTEQAVKVMLVEGMHQHLQVLHLIHQAAVVVLAELVVMVTESLLQVMVVLVYLHIQVGD
jgi:hypothetical protein